jgi:hypothetical protein
MNSTHANPNLGGLGTLAVQHPVKQIVTRAELDRFVIPVGSRIEEKLDGEFSPVRWRGHLLLAEKMRQKSGGLYTATTRLKFVCAPEYHCAFDVLATPEAGHIGGWMPLRERLDILQRLAPELRADGYDLAPASAPGETAVEFYDRIIADGGEGIVIKDLAAPYGEMWACKRGEIHLLRVSGHCGGTQSVFIADAQTGQPRGKVTLRGGKCDQVRVGSLLRIECIGITDKGLFRQPQPCREWLVKF